MRKVKWGVIGCGGIADRRTLPGMMLAENAELIAVMDVNPEFAKKCQEKYNAKYSFTDVESLLAVDEIEAVYIASPVFCHKEQALAAAKAGKHILLEKPVGLTVAEAEEIADACKAANIKLGIGFVIRFHNVHQKMKDIIAKGELGEIVSARAQFSCWYPEDEKAWRQVPKLSGGGALMDMGVHCIDLIRHITGLEVTAVSGMVGNQIFKYPVEDAGSVLMRMENGATAYVEANFNLPDDAVVCRLEIYGTKGSLLAEGTIAQDEFGAVVYRKADDGAAYDAAQVRSGTEAIEFKGASGNMYTKQITAFGDAIINGTDVPVTADDAILSQKIVEAAYMSSDKGITVKMA